MTHADTQRAAHAPDFTAGLVEALQRARKAVEMETAALRAHDLSGLAEHNARKDRSLLELTRRANRLNGAPPPHDARTALVALREAIIDNQAALRTQLHAARTISDILMRAIADEESDRTYSFVARRNGKVA